MTGRVSVCQHTLPGDLAGAVIIQIASVDEPPLRLLLGTDAVHLAEQNEIARIKAGRRRRELSLSTDFEAGGRSNVYPWERISAARRLCRRPRPLTRPPATPIRRMYSAHCTL
jgi:hypothetical protein